MGSKTAPPLGSYYRGEQFLINHYWWPNVPILLPMTHQQPSFTIEVGTKTESRGGVEEKQTVKMKQRMVGFSAL